MAVNHKAVIFPSAQEQPRSAFTDFFLFNPKSKSRSLIPICGFRDPWKKNIKKLIPREALCLLQGWDFNSFHLLWYKRKSKTKEGELSPSCPKDRRTFYDLSGYIKKWHFLSLGTRWNKEWQLLGPGIKPHTWSAPALPSPPAPGLFCLPHPSWCSRPGWPEPAEIWDSGRCPRLRWASSPSNPNQTKGFSQWDELVEIRGTTPDLFIAQWSSSFLFWSPRPVLPFLKWSTWAGCP